MKRLPLLLALLAAAGVLSSAEPAYAGKGDQAAAFVLVPFVFAALAYPAGLAVHALILGFAPRRARGLVSTLERHRGKTIVLGLLNTIFLLLVAGTLKKAAPGISGLAVLLWFTLALVGSHGIARGLGARALGRGIASEGPADLKELAVGWFVLLFALAVPGLGILLFLYWGVRATGGLILAILAALVPPNVDDEHDEHDDPTPIGRDLDPPGDINELIA